MEIKTDGSYLVLPEPLHDGLEVLQFGVWLDHDNHLTDGRPPGTDFLPPVLVDVGTILQLGLLLLLPFIPPLLDGEDLLAGLTLVVLFLVDPMLVVGRQRGKVVQRVSGGFQSLQVLPLSLVVFLDGTNLGAFYVSTCLCHNCTKFLIE